MNVLKCCFCLPINLFEFHIYSDNLLHNYLTCITPVPQNMKVHEQILASGTGGVLVALLATPFDVIKTRLIAQTLHSCHDQACFYSLCHGAMNEACGSCGYEHAPKEIYRGICQKQFYKGSVDAVFKISRQEGVTSLWNGCTPTLLQIVPSAIAYFTLYDFLKTRGQADVSEKYRAFVPSCAGVVARFVNVSLFSPIELVRTKAQSEVRLNYGQLRQVLLDQVRSKGVPSLWAGASSQLLRDVPFTLVYWFIQDKVKNMLIEQDRGTFFSNCGGAFAGASVASVISHPFDVAKTQIQANFGGQNKLLGKTPLLVMKNIYKTDGLRGYYVGLMPRMVKLVPSCAVMITTYEVMKEHFGGLR